MPEVEDETMSEHTKGSLFIGPFGFVGGYANIVGGELGSVRIVARVTEGEGTSPEEALANAARLISSASCG